MICRLIPGVWWLVSSFRWGWTVASNSLGCRTVRYCVSPVSVDIRVSPICVDTCCENPFLRGLLGFQTTESKTDASMDMRLKPLVFWILDDPCVMIGEADDSLTRVFHFLTMCGIGFAMWHYHTLSTISRMSVQYKMQPQNITMEIQSSLVQFLPLLWTNLKNLRVSICIAPQSLRLTSFCPAGAHFSVEGRVV